MGSNYYNNHEVVSRLIRFCHQGLEPAMQVYEQLIVGQQRSFELPDGKILLSQQQLAEVVEKFSSEVGPEIWQSKSGKY